MASGEPTGARVRLRTFAIEALGFAGRPLRTPWGLAMKLLHLGALRAAGVSLGPGVQSYGKVRVLGTGRVDLGAGGNLYAGVVLETQGAGRIRVGQRFVLNQGAILCARAAIEIGNHVLVGEYTSIRDNDHDYRAGIDKEGGFLAAPIRIEDRVWIGRGCCITSGVCIGAGSVVGANSVVTADLPPGVLAVGAPARVLRSLST